MLADFTGLTWVTRFFLFDQMAPGFTGRHYWESQVSFWLRVRAGRSLDLIEADRRLVQLRPLLIDCTIDCVQVKEVTRWAASCGLRPTPYDLILVATTQRLCSV